MSQARYLWGNSKIGYLSFDSMTAAPPAKAGRMYVDSDGHFNFCEDGTSFLLIRDVLHN